MNVRSFLALLGSIALCQLAGVLGALTTTSAPGSWYQELDKPPFNPPSWAFGVVWPILYTLMGIALWRVWRDGTGRSEVRTALALFFSQLVFNAVWSPIFFGLHSIGGGLVIITVLLALIVLAMRAMGKLDAPAFWLMVPYLLWVAFATLLNASILVLNGWQDARFASHVGSG